MAYTKNTWANGDIVTSEKLNHMEEGIKGAYSGVLVINDTNGLLDRTWQEIHDTMAQGKTCIVRRTANIPDSVLTIETVVSEYRYGGSVYEVAIASALNGTITYRAYSADELLEAIRPAFTIGFDANGGEGEIDDISVTEGQSIETLPDGSELTAPEGKVFGGWATTDSALVADVTAPYTPEESTTLYAVWIDET